MRTKIALDLDNVVINLHERWLPRLSAIAGRDLGWEDMWAHEFHRVLQVDRSVIDATYTPDIYDDAQPVEGAVDGVRRLAEIYDVVICSTTPHEFDAAKDAWLGRYLHGVSLDVRYCRPSEVKAKYLADCAVLLDDYPKNFDGLPPGVQPVIFERPWNRMDSFYPRVANWDAFLSMMGCPVAIG